ncbi:DUF5462 family protein [Salmonella enterica subsp. enterica serovar Saintpaul]|nr:fimbrial protein [Salmonella enterica]EHJ6659819.1 DUF5462 family protein [Salmonella enterica subsp. enterica serovar Saintpaul]EAQ0971131.1 fimbrial protein [Salmonella enterica]EAQ9126073.1 fimbrial protein [Salmonella enterica]EAT6281941.1 fimbrial protein [Salmonella enterica]
MSSKSSSVVIAGLMMATVMVTLPSGAAQQLTDKTLRLGVVNGQIKDNQIVEARRSLTDPMLYRAEDPNFLPRVLRIRNATARQGDNGTILVWVSQPLSTASRSASVTVGITLWVDGKKVPANYSQQGVDVLIGLPVDTVARQQVMLRGESPVTLQVPASWRGPVDVLMDISGEA